MVHFTIFTQLFGSFYTFDKTIENREQLLLKIPSTLNFQYVELLIVTYITTGKLSKNGITYDRYM